MQKAPFVFLPLSLVLVGCTLFKPAAPKSYYIPQEKVEKEVVRWESRKEKSPELLEMLHKKADMAVFSRVGEDFYEYISRDEDVIYFSNPNERSFWRISYAAKFPDAPGIYDSVSVYEDGEVKLYQLPNCKEDPAKCTISITKDEAVKIAKKVDFSVPEDGGLWGIRLKWSQALLTFIWEMLASIKEPDDEHWGEMEKLIIDANSGEVLEKKRYPISPMISIP